jgi:hypothetical protein
MRHLCDLTCLVAKQVLSQLSYTPIVPVILLISIPVEVRVAKDAMHKNKCTLDVFILLVEGMRAIDQYPRLFSGGLDPFGAIPIRRCAGCRYDADSGKQKSDDHGKAGYHMRAPPDPF